ncbi:MAG: N-6 DNA methylase [Magnetospirillum sp.]|nr:N-6 DNA methylase [Magnetospirillum sp.]
MRLPASEKGLAALALALIGRPCGLSPGEQALKCASPARIDADTVRILRDSILAGGDPLGEVFAVLRSATDRRALGAVYTPAPVIAAMLAWAEGEGAPARVVDPGAGSGRFLVAAAKRFPNAKLVAIEIDPLAALLLRANVSVLGLSERTEVRVDDYRATPELPWIAGRTLFIGNPPYVRHHDIPAAWKSWFSATAARRSIRASKLAGLHIHFFFRTLELARKGDFGAFITSAEWLDVNYGSSLRELLADGLGGSALHVIDPKAMPFADAATTGAITCFRVGRRPKALTVRAVPSLGHLESLSDGISVPWKEVEKARRWSVIVRPTSKPPAGYIELGELFRVSRGQVTGKNDIWIAGERAAGLPPDVLVPTVTKARELLSAGPMLSVAEHLRRVVNLPVDLEEIDAAYRRAVERFLKWAKSAGAADGYVARHRRAWWSVLLYDPAPVICTYMARRPPAFVRNLCDARHLNIAHGLYPRESIAECALSRLLDYLRNNVSTSSGRTYAGGLTKFEPRELERLPIPALEMLCHETTTRLDTSRA